MIGASGASFLVYVRNASSPQLQAALPHGTGPRLFEPDQVIVSDELGFRSYPAVLQNLSL